MVTSLFVRCQRVAASPLNLRLCRTLNSPPENQQTVQTLYDLSVDIQKVRKLKGWVLHQSPAYAEEISIILKNMGASESIVANILGVYPEAVLCHPEQMQTQMELWRTVCQNKKDLVGIIEKFPASFFTPSSDHENQRQNIDYFQSLKLNKRIITKLMACAPQSFSRPVEENKAMVHALQEAYLELGGDEANMKIWLQKLMSQNPFALLKPPELLRQNIMFLRDRGFTSAELLHLISKLKGFVTELNPGGMCQSLAYSQGIMGCSEKELRDIVFNCPALLYYPETVLAERFAALLKAGISMSQIMETPTVLELTTQIVNYRIQQLKTFGYDVRSGSLEALNGTKKNFEMSYEKLQIRKERPLFNPVAPLKGDD